MAARPLVSTGAVRHARAPRVGAAAGVAAVLGLAALLRFWALGQPDRLVFDELYYVRDAITQLAHGYPTGWPDKDPHMASPYGSEASYAVHPPLGKWLIALGLLVFSDGSGWGWRSAVALAGVATVAVTMRLGWWITRSLPASLVAGLVLAIDGVHVTLTRVGLLDGFLTLFITLGALCMWRDHECVVMRTEPRERATLVLWNRPWLLAAAATFGCAAAVKWSGLYPLAAFLLLTAVRDVWVRVAAARRIRTADRLHPWWRGFAQAFATGIIALPAALAVYVTSWVGWIVTAGGWGRDAGPWPVALWEYHVRMFSWHSTLAAPHPYQSNPLTWPLGLRPTAMLRESADGLSTVISPLPNLLVTWGGVMALFVLAWWIIRSLPRLSRVPYAAVFVVSGYLSGWVPWVLTISRPAVFQFYAVVLTPFSALALALVAAVLLRSRSEQQYPLPPQDDAPFLARRRSVVVFLVVAVLLSLWFFPTWSGMPVPDWVAQSHRWLPGW